MRVKDPALVAKGATGMGHPRIYSCEMEPAEKFLQRVLKVVLMIFAFIVSIVFEEFYRGLGWSLDFHHWSFNGRFGYTSLEDAEKLTEYLIRFELGPRSNISARSTAPGKSRSSFRLVRWNLTFRAKSARKMGHPSLGEGERKIGGKMATRYSTFTGLHRHRTRLAVVFFFRLQLHIAAQDFRYAG